MDFAFFGAKSPKTHVFPAFFELLLSFSMRNLNFSKRNHMFSLQAFVFPSKIILSQCLASSASALWFLSGSQCPPTWLRIALGFAEIVFRGKTKWILHFSAQNRPKRMFFRFFSSFCSAFLCEILIFPNEITCFHYKPLFSSAKLPCFGKPEPTDNWFECDLCWLAADLLADWCWLLTGWLLLAGCSSFQSPGC